MENELLYKEACREIIDTAVRKNLSDQQALNSLKMQILRKHNLKAIPKNIDIAAFATESEREKLSLLLTIKPTRTISGVATIAIMPRPIACRHGKCAYCPGGPGSVFGSVPQSYTGTEPATRRAIRNSYDPYLQESSRIEQYMAMNKVPEKIEQIIMGGTFTSFPEDYQEEFVKFTYKALNDFSEKFFRRDGSPDTSSFNEFFMLPSDIKDAKRSDAIHEKLLNLKGESQEVDLEAEKLRNEKTKMRMVALCFETRPDWAREKQIDNMLRFGATRVELGVQTVYNAVLDKIRRMHTVEDSIHATQLLKDSFLKVGYHMMPGLPEVGREEDILSLNQIVQNPDFMPDALKIYPCMVLRGTPLYDDWKAGKFTPLTTEQSADIITEFKRNVPKWLRIMRVQRDIPTHMTESGVDRTNLRQYIEKMLHSKGIKCSCIRCREPRQRAIIWGDVKILRQDYAASGGNEIFLSCEDTTNDILIGFLRLRKPASPFRKEIGGNTMGIRELHVYGRALGLGKKDAGSAQHRGIGKALMAEAEKIAKEEYDAGKLLVISGIGVREYYKKIGYIREGPYMAKVL